MKERLRLEEREWDRDRDRQRDYFTSFHLKRLEPGANSAQKIVSPKRKIMSTGTEKIIQLAFMA